MSIPRPLMRLVKSRSCNGNLNDGQAFPSVDELGMKSYVTLQQYEIAQCGKQLNSRTLLFSNRKAIKYSAMIHFFHELIEK